jgi:hypothetical protein
MYIMRKFLIAAMLSLSLITPSFAAEDTPKEPVVNEDVTNLAKQLADMIYLLESFGKKVETEFENFSKEFDKELEKKRKEDE